VASRVCVQSGRAELCLLRLAPHVEGSRRGVFDSKGCAERVWARCHRPEDKAAKKQRLLAEAEAREKGSESDKKKPVGACRQWVPRIRPCRGQLVVLVQI
jgi:hypothetical protein